MAAVYRRFVSLQQRYPVRMSLATGGGVMSLGDALVQLRNERFDAHRNAVVSAYNGATAPFFLFWWCALDRWWPGTALGAVARKSLMNQVCVGPFNSAFFLAWSLAVGAWLHSGERGSGSELDLPALGGEIAAKAREEVPGLLLTSGVFWFPANAANFMFVPTHLRILFMSSCSVVWGAYISFVVHR
eukprot:CAMPEP_0177215530 /NCGR_PEP_ID=MMETSP0367-20130122/34270_1 /TAXON_ID=447022 ORGANISM="Scrippsiella hangoei-like, Strain SHHI-4" /NCGR_SAMPLE_ID=MMETSP0367 /ASSEMBLY_ACC=CAM_ASM_000362 /LENGTH=186 /DNA_ID=CAMNT_0018664979 /DNA_START=58 /DNA_END=618 /DNA_ORIENTATION=-